MSDWQLLVVLLAIEASLCLAITALSMHFAYGMPLKGRPLIGVLIILTTMGMTWLAALKIASAMPRSRQMAGLVWGGALVMRIVLLPSTPIQEIDYYRYIWDGKVTSAGLDPYEFAPQAVLEEIDNRSANPSTRLSAVAQVADGRPGLETALRRIHYNHLPSPYPPVSQAVFAASMVFVPDDAGTAAYVLAMKIAITLFDLATLGAVVWILMLTGRSPAWGIAYGWCPLVLKEFANTGHLDSIASFFAVLSVALVLRSLAANQRANKSSNHLECSRHQNSKYAVWPSVWLFGSAIALALGIGAKLYPVLLSPLLGIWVWRAFGWRSCLLCVTVVAGCFVLMVMPFLPEEHEASQQVAGSSPVVLLPPPDASEPGLSTTQSDEVVTELPPPPAVETGKGDGLAAFLKQWEMNDMIFMFIRENMRDQRDVSSNRRPWFALGTYVDGFGFSRQQSFYTARAVTGLIWMGLMIWLAARTASLEDQSEQLLGSVFLTLAWFLLLAPTQNPWYFCWIVPWLPWARSCVWYFLPIMVLAYYLRFWFAYEFHGTAIAGTIYQGEEFFHQVIVWFEFLPWMLWLAVDRFISRRPST